MCPACGYKCDTCPGTNMILSICSVLLTLDPVVARKTVLQVLCCQSCCSQESRPFLAHPCQLRDLQFCVNSRRVSTVEFLGSKLAQQWCDPDIPALTAKTSNVSCKCVCHTVPLHTLAHTASTMKELGEPQHVHPNVLTTIHLTA